MKARLTCVAASALVLALSVISIRYISDFWLLAFVNSFQLHIAVLAALFALMCLVVLRSRIFIMLLAWAFVLSAHALYMHREFVTQAYAPQGAKPFRLLSFNVLMENGRNAESIADTIVASKADVAYVMEAAALTSVLPRLSQTYPHRLGCGQGVQSCDLLILSKRPLENARIGSLSYVSRERFAMATINLDGQELTLAAAHLAKPYFDEYHRNELSRIRSAISSVSGPLILGGDFNSASIAPDMGDFLLATDLKKAQWEPATWPTGAGQFGIAIDHIFARQPATLMKLDRLPDSLGSNHYGLVADFAIATP
ncbi:endonuclease/exonuclease/phosphatase (EEP) superfamily protein YafD [Rhizobium skierniewicense]|uniref:Endonuclease/exonuclease/phosphatase (EEP) superfamily protein YafD n=1 Tax=Rhizobium skierniewicense TaxID=984260 RepID=A0A7W6C7W9_9HYPH|nr:endonuclease/exonuclease/phosphatase family protein [Rhizobium skierniewicense]MBB3945613.1 endonuclease/exonuclease/phosphatase (EEP) superfamily protein YafD [Rhizobium skierniewicense]